MMLLLALLACRQQETQVAQIPGTLSVIPAISDAGDVPIGETEAIQLQLNHVAGPEITVVAVDVFNLEGSHFALVGELPVIPVSGTGFVDLEFTPTLGGYHRAIVTVHSNAERTPEVAVEVRGHGVPPDVQRWPGLLDFGPALPPTGALRTVTIANNGALDVVVSGASFVGSGFTLASAMPVVIGPGATNTVDVAFDPVDASAAHATVDFDVGAFVDLPSVELRANDCAFGDPELFDVDNDGWTSCGGDCDDDAIGVFPGSPELADGTDQDCDGVTDEGTTWFDDDGDCYCEGTDCVGSISPGCTLLALGDCNDGDGTASPSTAETIGNGVDDNCDGVVDQGTTDLDHDGYSPGGGDCNDNDPTVRPGAPEAPDGVDDDCDGDVDDGTERFDDDGDGFCETGPSSDGSLPGDCDDNADDVDADQVPDGYDTHPLAVELADGRDNNCDGLGPNGTNLVDEGTSRFDDDFDGFSEIGGDCNDADATVNPGRIEIRGNGRDDDCNISTVD